MNDYSTKLIEVLLNGGNGMCQVNVGKSNRIELCAKKACSRNILFKGKGIAIP